MRKKLNRLLALVLCALMMTSDLTGLIPAAQAAPAATTATAAESQPAPLADATTGGTPLDFEAENNGRPNLFVHFLGDNYYYKTAANSGIQLSQLPIPASYDQSKETNPDSTDPAAPAEDKPGNTWARYQGGADMVATTEGRGDVIFWVGLGVDRREVFELLKGQKGLTSLEAGFYYDSEFIEPYVDGSGSFKTTIENANIANGAYPANTQWSNDYEILRAETDMKPATDAITQEEIVRPSIDEILSDSDWKMTYVSLELQDLNAARRLAGEYKGVDALDTDGDSNPITPDPAHGTGMQGETDPAKNDYQYLLLIPFRLKRYGDPNKLALRLCRNATHFSMGGGPEGAMPYAAWERVTTRNPGKDIKLLTRFNGDLALFGAKPEDSTEVEYKAKLVIKSPTPLNTAQLAVDGDPAVWPVKATQDGEIIDGLRSGIGMVVDTAPQLGYTVTVTVEYEENGVTKSHAYKTVVKDKKFTFVMPKFSEPKNPVVVTVVFGASSADLHVFLSELFQSALGAPTQRKVGDEAKILTNLTAAGAVDTTTNTVTSIDPPYTPHPAHPSGSDLEPHGDGPVVIATPNKKLRVEVGVHVDNMAVVRIYNFATSRFIVEDLKINSTKGSYTMVTDQTKADYGSITLPYGGSIELDMPAGDLDVEIIYKPAPRYKATLEVYHEDLNDITPMNTAQLAYLVYDEYAVSSNAYSGVVYHLEDDTGHHYLDDHRAVKTDADNKRLPWVAASQASLSGSLAGDTSRSGAAWNPKELTTPEDPVLGLNTVMTQLRSAAKLSDFATALSALDLNSQAVGTAWTGLRKDFEGQGYSESDVAALKSQLWDMRTQILNDPTLKALYDKTVTKTENGATTTLYSYLDLTAAQVQAYILKVAEAQAIERANEYQYEQAYKKYLEAKALYDEAKAKPALATLVTAVSEPIKPQAMTFADAKGVRKYQDKDYQNTSGGYLAEYDTYLTNYNTYISAVLTSGSVSGITPPTAAPAAKAMVPIKIPTPTEAQTQLDNVTFQTGSAGASPTIQTREDRKVWVVLEGDSAYYVSSVDLFSVDSHNNAVSKLTTITPTKESGDYANVWSFTMPQQNCAVRVTYARRSTRNLYVQIIGADDESDNLTRVEAYRQADHDATHYPTEAPAVAPVLAVITNEGNQDKDPYPEAPTTAGQPDPRYIYNVFEESIVTLRVKKKDGYGVTVKVVNNANNDEVTTVKVPAPDPADGDIYTFKVSPAALANDRVVVTVTYDRNRPQHDAWIDYHTTAGSTLNGANTALWRVEDPGPPPSVSYTDHLTDVYEETHLVGDISVQPGYYIYGVVVRGASGNYPYTITGNGYNGGFGTAVSGTDQPVKIYVDMPAEDLYVDVYFKEGVPDPEPVNTLTLTVKDPDNEGTDLTKVAQNWAKATVYDLGSDGKPDTTATLTTLGEVGRHQDHGNDSLYDWDYVSTGKWVKVEFNADTDYYVSKVTVGPSNLGVAMIWESDSSVSFYMPAGSAGICVEFAKGDPPTYFLNVRETWFDLATNGPVTGAENKNYVTKANSGTILGWNNGIPVTLRPETNPERVPGADATISAKGAAKSGEKVTMTYTVNESEWYIQSIILFSDGAATRLTDSPRRDVTPAGAPAGQKTYEVDFIMPTGDAEFAIHYRKGPKPLKLDYAFTMVLYDSDNTDAKKDDNRLSATFTDAAGTGGTHPKMELGLALTTPMTTDVRHIHPGDVVTLETTLQEDYTVDYLIINPSNLSIYPAWQSVTTDANGVTKGVATFTMPTQGVAVVARYIKGTPKQYSANLILRPPAGYTMAQAGKGTFADPTAGTLTGYPKNAVFSTSQTPGTPIDYDLYAADGFYIEKVTIEPKVGATASLSGSFGYQSGGFVMPAADVNVNVWFKKGWPDEAKYGLTLEVHDAAQRPDNYAALRSAGSTAFAPTDSDPVHGGESKTVWNAAFDKDTVVVDLYTEAKVPGDATRPGYYYSADSISVTDTQGNAISWWFVPGGLAFTMPPRSTKVVVTFKEDPGTRTKYQAKLVVLGAKTDGAAGENDQVKLEAVPTYATPQSLTAGGTITGLYPTDALTLSAQPGANRHIAAAYAVYTSGGRTETVPIYQDGALVAPPELAQFVPGDPANAVKGRFVMPEGDVTVYVKFADKLIRPTDQWVTLRVSGDPDAGSAGALIDEPDGVQDQSMTVYTPLATLPAGAPAGAATGMDTRVTAQGREVTVTFRPTDNAPAGKKYDIVKLEVYDKNGLAVPYEWISVIQDPPALTDTNMWPDPPTDPSATITHPTWIQNPLRQIKLTVPKDSVTVHVTYGEVDKDKDFTAQIVVNDPYPATPTSPSRNNAWFGLLDDAAKARVRTAKPGEWIDLSATVHPGYKIEFIKVVPQSYGLAPTLPYGDIYDQNTGFYMPNGDCTVYVKFIKDPTEQKNATLMVIGAPTGNANNYATIHSPISGTSKHAIVNGASRQVSARPTVDWITVDYYWDSGDAVESISVKTPDGLDVPFTQNEDPVTRHGQIVLPMPAKNVNIILVYKDDPTPVSQQVVLHVIDKDRDADNPILRDVGGTSVNYGRLEAVYDVTADTGLVGPDTARLPADPFESTATIFVPAGQRVNLTACSDALDLDGNGKVYIASAYALYEDGGQMLNMNLTPDDPGPGFSGLKRTHFIVRPGRNDIYVTLTRRDIPTQNEHAAILMLKAPDDNAGQAGICVGDNYDTAPETRKDGLTQANHGHAVVTAAQGEGITVNVVPAEGYVIDYIQVTPLGYPLSYTYLPVETTARFDMPHCNIAITVYLKKAEKDAFTLTLHYLEDTGAESKENYARADWSVEDGDDQALWAWKGDASTNPPGATRPWGATSSALVKADTEVTLWSTLNNSDVILAAYVLSDGDLVPLTPTYPAGLTQSDGLEGVGETASAGDNTKADALATFDMPSANTDVYLITTTTPPHPDWHTIILTASDYSPAGNDLGLSLGHIKAQDWSDADRKTVKSFGARYIDQSHAILTLPEYKDDGTRNYYTVVAEPAANYTLNLSKTHLTKNTPVNLQALSPFSTSSDVPPVVTYQEPVGDCNRAVHLVFESLDDLTLTVEIDDPDNPGNGTVTNALTAATTGVDTLSLASQSIAGAYQIMSGVTPGAPVNLTVTPNVGYHAYAKLYKNDGSAPVEVPLTASGGKLVGSFAMPVNTARVVVTFYIPYNGTLVLRDNTGFSTKKAQMTESTGTAPSSVQVTSLMTQSATLTHLPRGTELKANMVDFDETAADKKVTALLTANGSTTFLTGAPEAGITYYTHTIDRSDATITLIVDDKGTAGEDYIAAVQVLNRPPIEIFPDSQLPTITDTTTTGKVQGDIWTTADDGDNIQLHVNVPAGYKAEISTNAPGLTLDGGSDTVKTITVGGDTTFKMPARDVQVTVKYVKTHYRLKLHIVDTSAVTGNATKATPAAGSVLGSGLTDLDADGESTYVQSNAAVSLSATPVTDAKIKRIFYQYAGTTHFATITDPTSAYTAAPLLTMPEADVDVTVVYGSGKTPPPAPSPDPEDYYIAVAVKDDPDNDPGNKLVSIQNTTRNTLLGSTTPLPASSPAWTAGYADDAVTVSYEAAPGYYVTATAKTAGGQTLPILQIGATSVGTATTAFPNPGEDIVITVTYSKTPPTYPKTNVALQLVDHEKKAGNKATTTDFTAARLAGLTIAGNSISHAPGYPSGTASLDPVEIIKSESETGNDLRTLANWASGCRVVRMTVAVRDTATGQETGEVDLLVSQYGGQATARCPVPPLKDGEIPVVRVYYGNIYDATLHVVGADLPYDVTEATDDRPTPISSTGSVPIKNTGDKLKDFRGGESVMTTAKADTDATGGVKKRLVGVVWESDLTGARATVPAGNDRYDFKMPLDNVDFYAVYEKDDPKNRSYIAKVALADDSEEIAGTNNAVSIRNDSNTKAAHGNYWVAAKGGDSVVVTVKVQEGYQAQVIATKADTQTKEVLEKLPKVSDGSGGLRYVQSTDAFQYYINRTQFIYNLPSGKDATFTMPADTDATVTVKFTQGYDFTLTLDDQTTADASKLTGTTTEVTNQAVAQVTKGTVTVNTYGTVTAQTKTDATNNKKPTTSNSVTAGNGPHTTVLDIIDGNIIGNTVKIYPTAQHTIYVSGNESTIRGLEPGTEMTVFVEVASGCTADIRVTNGGAPVYTDLNTDGGEHKFTVPNTATAATLKVNVTFIRNFSLRSAASPYAAANMGDTIYNLPGNLDVTTTITPDMENTTALGNVVTRVTRTTPFTGTQYIAPGTSSKYPFVMPYEDTLETVLLQNKDAADPWMAKVELDGESDVTGNTATPIVDHTDTTELVDTDNDGTPDAPANVTTTGAVWTTTDEGHTIDLKLTVAKGYVAKIKVRRDDSYVGNENDSSKWVYLDAWEYDFTHVVTTSDGTTQTTDEKPMVTNPAPATVAKITEVQTGYGEGYLLASAFPASVSGDQHFRFTMPAAKPAVGTNGDPDYVAAVPMTDVTVIVTFEKAGDMPRPFDPDNKKMDKIDLDRGFIYGENRGDFAVIEIPTLATQESKTVTKLYDTDNYDSASTPPTIHDSTKSADTEVKRYIFALYDAATDQYTDLVEGTDVMLAPYDEETLSQTGDLYNYILGLYEGSETLDANTDKRKFVGSKFLLLPKPKADGTFTANGQKLYDMLDNKGSLESYDAKDPTDANKTVKRWRTTLYVMAEDAAKRQSEYTPVWIRPWFALGVNVVSYGPTHPLEGELFRLMTQEELDVASGYKDNKGNVVGTTQTVVDDTLFTHYQWNKKDPSDFDDSIVLEEEGSGKWLQVLRVRSSELLGGFDTDYDPTEDFTAATPKTLLDNVDAAENLTYALAVKKDSNLTYRRVKIDLNPHHYTAPAKLADYYQTANGAPDPSSRTFMIQDTIYLMAGDVDGNRRIKYQDYDQVYDFVFRNRPWTTLDDGPTKPTTSEPAPGGTADPTWDAYYAAQADWSISVYNPQSMAYRCDLDGDRRLTVGDVDIVLTRFNYNRTEDDYNWRKSVGSTTTWVLPFGLGARSSDYAALFALGAPIEGELLADGYWDETVDPDTTEAVPLDTIWVDENGMPWVEEELPELPTEDDPAPTGTHGEREEIPLGDEVSDVPAADLPMPEGSLEPIPESESDLPQAQPEGEEADASEPIDTADEVDVPAPEPAAPETAPEPAEPEA